MLGPFSSPLAKHLHRAAVSSTADGSHRLSFGSGNGGPPPPQQRTPPGSISSIQVGPSPGEPLGVHSPTASPAARSRLAQASGPGDAPPSPSRQPPPPLLPTAPPDSPAAALQQLAVSKQRSAVAAAAAAMQSPAPAARPGQLRPLSAAGGTPRSGAAAFSTPLASSRPQLFAAPAAAAASPAPPSSAGSAQQQQQAPRSSFKQQAQQLQQQPPLQVGLTPGSGLGSAQRPRPRALVQQQQQTPPPAASLEEAMGQLQLQGSLAAAAATPGLKMRSRGLLTPLGTPRSSTAAADAGRTPAPSSAAAGAAAPAAAGATLLPAAQQQAAEPQPLWSPMVPAAAPGAAQGAGLLGTVHKGPRPSRPLHHVGSSALSAMESGEPAPAAPPPAPAAAAASTPAPAAAAALGLQQEASFGAPAEDPAQLRRQLQVIVPELTLTQPLQLAARGAGESASASRSAALQRPAPVPDRAAAAQILERMRRLQGAAAELLQEQAAACTCASMAEGFRAALAPAGEAAGRSSQAVVPGQPQRKQASGPTPAAAAKLAQLAQLRVAGAELAGHLA